MAQGECHGDDGTELALALLPLANLGARDAQAGFPRAGAGCVGATVPRL